MEHLDLTYIQPYLSPTIQHTARRQRVRLRSSLKEMCEGLPVFGDRKSGIPAEVLTPVHPSPGNEVRKEQKTPVNTIRSKENIGKKGWVNAPAPN